MSLTHNPAAAPGAAGGGVGLASPASIATPQTDTAHHHHGTHPGTQSQPPTTATKPQKVLACQLCQQRKVKCDRKFPCTNCVRAKAACIPATLLPRQRRRRFPERELLARIRHYEAVLQQHNIGFEPLHPATNPATVHPGSGGGGGVPAAESRSQSESPETLVECGSPDTTRTFGSSHGKGPAKLRATCVFNHFLGISRPVSEG